MAAGDTWHSNRKFFIEKFCGDGTGKTGLETSTEEEVRDFVQYLEHEENNKSEGTSLDVITVPVSNILWKMLTGKLKNLTLKYRILHLLFIKLDTT